mmetsp:Transcript_29088/g.70806  ORF Transcript_29088/g.70806 Transcript_29088/m.70806 type:complete len:254 (+) Transcript_29088:205-966(+)
MEMHAAVLVLEDDTRERLRAEREVHEVHVAQRHVYTVGGVLVVVHAARHAPAAMRRLDNLEPVRQQALDGGAAVQPADAAALPRRARVERAAAHEVEHAVVHGAIGPRDPHAALKNLALHRAVGVHEADVVARVEHAVEVAHHHGVAVEQHDAVVVFERERVQLGELAHAAAPAAVELVAVVAVGDVGPLQRVVDVHDVEAERAQLALVRQQVWPRHHHGEQVDVEQRRRRHVPSHALGNGRRRVDVALELPQ